MHSSDPEYERKVQRQLAILDVARRVTGGETSDEITAMLRVALSRRRLEPPPGAWLNSVARDISLGSVYVISGPVMDEAGRRLEHSRATRRRGTVPVAAAGSEVPGQTVHEVTLVEPAAGRNTGLSGWLATPDGTGPWPAVVMLPDASGGDAAGLSQLRRAAAAGFLVLMPGLFRAGHRRLVPSTRVRGSQRSRSLQDIETARSFLLDRADCTGAVAVLGFGAGGTLALASAARGFDAVGVNEAKIPRDVAVQLQGAAPLVASYGARDRLLASSASRLERALRDRTQQERALQEGTPQEGAQDMAIDYDVKTYPDAGRGFLNGPDDGPRGRRWLRAGLGFLTGAGPDPHSADDAWNRTGQFFHRHLQTQPHADS